MKSLLLCLAFSLLSLLNGYAFGRGYSLPHYPGKGWTVPGTKRPRPVKVPR